MLQLSEIWIYPVKSLGGIAVQSALVTARGLEHDRRWMLVDEQGVFLSQRTTPELALFGTDISDNYLVISHRDQLGNTLKIDLNATKSTADELIKTMVWDDAVDAIEVGSSFSAWFSTILKQPVRLVYMPEESHRKVDPNFAQTTADINSFSDGFPFLIIGQTALDDLNARLKEAVPMKRFRPNFVFTGGQASEEETWSELTIGNHLFHGVKPCGRCVLVTVDPEKGVLAGKEPLLTLFKYKRSGNNVIFGQNLIAAASGRVSVGDAIAVSKTKIFEIRED